MYRFRYVSKNWCSFVPCFLLTQVTVKSVLKCILQVWRGLTLVTILIGNESIDTCVTTKSMVPKLSPATNFLMLNATNLHFILSCTVYTVHLVWSSNPEVQQTNMYSIWMSSVLLLPMAKIQIIGWLLSTIFLGGFTSCAKRELGWVILEKLYVESVKLNILIFFIISLLFLYNFARILNVSHKRKFWL